MPKGKITTKIPVAQSVRTFPGPKTFPMGPPMKKMDEWFGFPIPPAKCKDK